MYILTLQNIQTMQENTQKLAAWEKEWDMVFNIRKCKHITFSHKKHASENSLFLDDIPISKAQEVIYLGVTLRANCYFSTHTSSIAGRVNAKLASEENPNWISHGDGESLQTTGTAYWYGVRQRILGPNHQHTSRRALNAGQQGRWTTLGQLGRTTSVTDLISSMQWDPLSARRKHRRLAVFRSFHFDTNTVRSYLEWTPRLQSSCKNNLQ